jgi:thiamine pyrophosphate-dependent acetolactate synthase large subunit-like protein
MNTIIDAPKAHSSADGPPTVDVAHAILDCLRAENITHVFGIAGSSFLELLDAFRDYPDITYVGVRHEQGAAHMAEGYARSTFGRNAKFGACVATSGPGVTNLITGVAMAQQSCTPMIVLGGAISAKEEYKGSKQELDQLNLFRPVTKDVVRIASGDRAGELMRYAIRLAMSGQRGPVYVDIPKDVFAARTAQKAWPRRSYRPLERVAPSPEAVAEAVSLLRGASRPLILAGAEFKWLGGTPELVAFAETLNIPVVTSAGHRDVMPSDHPLFFGQLGQRGSTLARELGRSADVIFAMGTRLAFNTTTFNGEYLNLDAQLIQSGLEAKEIGRHFPLALGFIADAASTAQACTEHARALGASADCPEWMRWAEERRAAWLEARNAPLSEIARPIHSSRLYALLRRIVPQNVQVVVDSGYLSGRAHDAFDHTICPSLHTPLDFRCVGPSLPMAMGVQFAQPDAPILSIQGDGGFAMNMQELETAVRFGLNPVVLILNNFAWGAEKQHQKKQFGSRYAGSEMGNPRFDRIAEAFGCVGRRVESLDDLPGILDEAWRSTVPTVIDVIMDESEI